MAQVFKGSGDGKTRNWLSWEAKPVWIKAETYLAAPNGAGAAGAALLDELAALNP